VVGTYTNVYQVLKLYYIIILVTNIVLIYMLTSDHCSMKNLMLASFSQQFFSCKLYYFAQKYALLKSISIVNFSVGNIP